MHVSAADFCRGCHLSEPNMEFRLKFVVFSGLLALLVHLGGVEGGWYENSICFKGQRQSPINIPKMHIKDVKGSNLILSDDFYKYLNFDIENEHGHTLSGYMHNNKQLIATGPLMEWQRYIFISFHLHWGPAHTRMGSDHHLSSNTYSTELHLLFYNSKYPNKDAAIKSGDPRGIAVIALLFQVGDKSNPHLEPIVRAANNRIVHPNAKTQGWGLNLGKLIFNGEYRFAYFGHYLGSLTTLPCNEVVMWNVKMHPLPISRDQLRAFATLKTHSGVPLINNFRGTRPRNGRKIEYFRLMPNQRP